MTHTIYHIPGRKVGCTIEFEKRKKAYSTDTVFEVLEVLHDSDHQTAGDCEWKWADHFGYKRGLHYADVHRGIETLGFEGLSARSKKGREKANATLGPEGRSAKAAKGSAKRIAAMGPEGLSAKSLKGWETRRANGFKTTRAESGKFASKNNKETQ